MPKKEPKQRPKKTMVAQAPPQVASVPADQQVDLDNTQLIRGVLDLAVLAVLTGSDGYGYDIVRRLREAGLEDVGDASVYGTLRRLFKAGALTTYVQPSDEGPHRKYYGLTPLGRETYEVTSKSWMRFRDTIDGLVGGV